MDNEILINEPEVNMYETGVTPEDVLKRSHNGMALRKAYGVVPWKKDSDIYDPAKLQSIKITTPAPVLQVGGSVKLNVEQTPELANLPELCWESSDIEVAWVNSEGIVYAVKEGNTDITVSKPASNISDIISVFVTIDGKIGPEKPTENENTEEQQAIEDNVEQQIAAGTYTITLDGTANNLTIPAETPKAVTINGAFQDGATINNEGAKSITINNTGDPVDIVINSENASVTLKGNFNNVWANSKTVNASGAKIGSVTFDTNLEGKGNLSVNADWNDPVEVISYNTNKLSIQNASDTTVLESLNITAPRATVTLNGQWGEVEATVSTHTLYIGAKCHVNKLKVNSGNVIVYNCFPEQNYDEIELAEGCTVKPYTKYVPAEGTGLTSDPGIYEITEDCTSTNCIVFGAFASGNYKFNNHAHVVGGNKNAICLTRTAVNAYFDGDGVWENPNGYGIWKAYATGELKIYGGTFIAQTHAVYAEKGIIEIYGGEFKVSGEDKKYLLNCKDENYSAGTANIKVFGGKFYGFDPAHSMSEPGGEVSFVQEGYESVEIEPGVFEVKAVNQE